MTATIMLRGGLGNQLFQVTAGVHFAIRNSTDLLINDSAIIRHQDISRRSWIREFNLQSMFQKENISWTNPRYSMLHNWRERLFRKKILGEEDLLSRDFHGKNFAIYDWFQSSKYLPAQGIKLKRLDISNLSRRTVVFATDIESDKQIGAIHIRLGDFKETSWGILPTSWYRKSVIKLLEHDVQELHCYSEIGRAHV